MLAAPRIAPVAVRIAGPALLTLAAGWLPVRAETPDLLLTVVGEAAFDRIGNGLDGAGDFGPQRSPCELWRVCLFLGMMIK